MHDEISRILERIRPALEADGARVGLKSVSDSGVVVLRVMGVGQDRQAHIQASLERSLCAQIEDILQVECLFEP